MSNHINQDFSNLGSSLIGIANEKIFVKLDKDIQKNIINNLAEADAAKRDAGAFGQILGTNTKNVVIHAGLLICIILVIVLIMDCLHAYYADQGINMDLVNVIIPVITLYLGYIFGKGPAQDE